MKLGIIVLCVVALAAPSFSAVKKNAKTKPSASRQTISGSKSVRTRTRTRTKIATKTGIKTSAKMASHVRRTAAPASSRALLQGQPSSDRYKEIQEALVTKGYLKSEATGQWSGESADALKRFQSDQNLTSDGKLNSLSLIALGLGPKRSLTAQAQSAQPAQPAVKP